MTQTLSKHMLALALTTTLAASGAALAQSGTSEAKVRTRTNAHAAVADALMHRAMERQAKLDTRHTKRRRAG